MRRHHDWIAVGGERVPFCGVCLGKDKERWALAESDRSRGRQARELRYHRKVSTVKGGTCRVANLFQRITVTHHLDNRVFWVELYPPTQFRC